MLHLGLWECVVCALCMYVCMYASVRMLFVVSFISIRHFLFSVYKSVCILYIVGSMFAIILCQIVTLPCGTVVSTDITRVNADVSACV